MKNCVDVLLPIVTNIVNCSLDSYTVPHVMKEALVRPILKKASLDHEQLKNYRPISNLPFIAKCCEKVVAHQLNQYLAVNELNEVFQSAYKRYNRDLKILDAAALKNAVTSEGAWVENATSAREKQTLRFSLWKRWPERVTTNRFSQRIRGFHCYDFV